MAPPPAPPSSGGLSVGAKVAIAVVALLFVLGGVALATSSGGDDDADTTTTTTTEADDPSTTTSTTEADEPDEVDLPEGFALIDGDGVSAAVPEGWNQFTASDLDLPAEELAELFPDADPALLANFQTIFQQGAVLLAIDSTQLGGFAANINILEVPGSTSLDDIAGPAVQQLSTLGGEVDEPTEVALPAGRALRISYTVSSGGTAAQGVQFYVPDGNRTFIVSVTASEGAGELGDDIMDTFTID